MAGNRFKNIEFYICIQKPDVLFTIYIVQCDSPKWPII